MKLLFLKALPGAVALAGVVALSAWVMGGRFEHLTPRLPGADNPREEAPDVLARGTTTPGEGIAPPDGPRPAPWPNWPQFRGPNRDGIYPQPVKLLRSWGGGPPKELWALDVGQGYGGAAVWNGRVYLMDYDAAGKADALRCLALADGKEIWRYSYPLRVKRNHGMSRTVPTVTPQGVVVMGPKCHVTCVDPLTGEFRWAVDLVRDYGATVPDWYAGQCPLVDGDKVILAPGGPGALLLAVDLQTGKEVWRTPNPEHWLMTHSSVTPMMVAGQRTYVYCGAPKPLDWSRPDPQASGNGGVVGVAADGGRILWKTNDWQIKIATVPTPLAVGDGKVFFSGGYDSGSLMLEVKQDGSQWTTKVLYRLDAKTFGSTQQTPILYEGRIYGMRPDGQFTCLDPATGKALWASGRGNVFGQGMGPYLLADGLIFAMNDAGRLTLLEASPEAYKRVVEAQVFAKGHDSWGPMALAGDRLILRDFTRLACLEVGE